MATTLDQGFTREWYGRLPLAFRDADALDGDLWSFLRLFGDPVGGLTLVINVLEGRAFVRPIVLADGTILTLGPWLTVDGPGESGGVLVLLDPPVTELDGDDPDILVITSGDWTLTDPLTLPSEWVPWVAQALGVDLSLVPQAAWREWIANPVSRAVGSLPSLLALAAYHLDDLVVPTVTRPEFQQITFTVPAASITTSAEELQAVLTAAEPAGCKVLLATT